MFIINPRLASKRIGIAIYRKVNVAVVVLRGSYITQMRKFHKFH